MDKKQHLIDRIVSGEATEEEFSIYSKFMTARMGTCLKMAEIFSKEGNTEKAEECRKQAYEIQDERDDMTIGYIDSYFDRLESGNI